MTETAVKIRKITYGDLHIGQLLPWDVFGESGSLLARKGHLVATSQQLDSLVERGVFEDTSVDVPVIKAPPSALRIINTALHDLQAVLDAIAARSAPADGDAAASVRLAAIAARVADAVDVSADVAVASILHNQQAAPYSVRHCLDTAIVAYIVARAMKKTPDELATVTQAALTMNVGMHTEHDRLQQAGAELDAPDRALIQSHPYAGAVLLREAGIADDDWLACVRGHHENVDGSGYPARKMGAELSEATRVLALADRYCARVVQRAYRKPMLPNAALRDILLEAKQSVDGQMAAVLIRELGIYPVGTYVRLLNGEVGVVARKGLQSTAPWVESMIGPRGAPLDVFLQRDTRADLSGIREVLSAEQAKAPFRMEQVWGRAASLS